MAEENSDACSPEIALGSPEAEVHVSAEASTESDPVGDMDEKCPLGLEVSYTLWYSDECRRRGSKAKWTISNEEIQELDGVTFATLRKGGRIWASPGSCSVA